MMFLECKTYNAIFDVKEVEASIIIANPKALCTTITNIMLNLILYGNIGSASLIIDNAKQDLHIDIYKYITDNVKTLFPVPEYLKNYKLILLTTSNLIIIHQLIPIIPHLQVMLVTIKYKLTS